MYKLCVVLIYFVLIYSIGIYKNSSIKLNRREMSHRTFVCISKSGLIQWWRATLTLAKDLWRALITNLPVANNEFSRLKNIIYIIFYVCIFSSARVYIYDIIAKTESDWRQRLQIANIYADAGLDSTLYILVCTYI